MKEVLSKLLQVVRRCAAALRLPAGMTSLDMLLLRWVGLSVPVLLVVMVLLLTNGLEWADEAQLYLICDAPFYLEAEAAQNVVPGPVGMFALCAIVTLYLSLVLLREPTVVGRLQMVVPALVAALLPGLLCVLWDCVFPVAPLVLCVLLTWGLTWVPFYNSRKS
ncbi:MAG: hypothetical protein Q4F35_01035 [Akkermansia sp.]|nr:hypothetical protein [Akkermansia sp.]